MVAFAEIYLDETGTHDGSPVMGVAGYVFMRSKARKFTKVWNAHLAAQGIPFFHMADCAPGNAHYKKWTTNRRDAHERTLIKLIQNTSEFGFAECCSLHGMENLKSLEMPSRYDAYTMMLTFAVFQACEYLRARSFKGRASFFFESGHSHQRQALEVIARIVKHNPSDFFDARIDFVKKTDAAPIQAADLLAWLARNSVIKTLDDKPARRDFLALVVKNHHLKYYTEQDLIGIFDAYAGRDPKPIRGSPLVVKLPD